MRPQLALVTVALTLCACASPNHSVSNPGGGNSVGSLSEPYTEFRGSTAASPSDVWAVGVYFLPAGNQSRIEHWNGARWSVLPAAPNGGSPDTFNAVATNGPDDTWAVGSSAGVAGHQEVVLVEHWNGQGWSVVAAPNPSQGWNELDAVVALSPSNVWAAGYAQDYVPPVIEGNTKIKTPDTPARVLIEHWDGRTWTVVAAPNPGTNWNQLVSLSSSGSNDVWAVGWMQDDGPRQALVEHWNGVGWTQMVAGGAAEFRGVAAVAPNCAWAVGGMGTPQFISRWDGKAWTTSPAPTISKGVELWTVSARSCSDVWVGGVVVGRKEQPLLEHWDGSGWTTVPSPGGISNGRLTAVTILSATDIWLFGTRVTVQPLTLIEHWNGTTWSIVESPA